MRRAIAAMVCVALVLACSDGGSDPTNGGTAPGVTISIGTSFALAKNASTSTAVTVARVGGYSGDITLSASSLPTGITVTFSPSVLSGSVATSTMSLASTGSAVVGATSILISAAGPGIITQIMPVVLTISDNGLLATLGQGAVPDRYTAEVWVRGSTAYTTTWGTRNATGRGNAIKIWDISANTPVLVDSIIVAAASTLGDVQVSDDGALLVAAIESNPNGGLAVYQLTAPKTAVLLARTTGGELQYGVHTAEIARVNGVLYAFCAIDPANGVPARLVIVSLANPSQPTTVVSRQMGSPYIHDVFVRNGLLFTAEWNDGVGIWDIGGGNAGGSVANPVRLSRLATVGGKVHNIWWYHDPVSTSKRYAFIGEEGPGVIGSQSVGDIHVVDVSVLTAPIEVARFTVAGAGVHNFSVDEANGLLYAAFYNGGVRVLDIRGDLSTCTVAQRTLDGRCDLGAMGREYARFTGNGAVYVWGVHWSASGLFASDMLNGLWRIAPAMR